MKSAKSGATALRPDGQPAGKHGYTGEGWQAEKSALTRQSILEASVRCFVDHGYASTTTAMIAEEANVSRGAMMHHFPSRSAVMNAVVGYLHVRRLNEYRDLMVISIRPIRQMTRAAIRTSVEAAWKYVNLPSFVAYQELLGAARTDPALAEAVGEVERDFEREFLKTVRSDFSSLETSEVTSGSARSGAVCDAGHGRCASIFESGAARQTHDRDRDGPP